MLQAVHLMCSSKKGISAHQLHRILEVQYKTAWFLAHRIREAMRTGALLPMGGAGPNKAVRLLPPVFFAASMFRQAAAGRGLYRISHANLKSRSGGDNHPWRDWTAAPHGP
jgi:hypothetical protein